MFAYAKRERRSEVSGRSTLRCEAPSVTPYIRRCNTRADGLCTSRTRAPTAEASRRRSSAKVNVSGPPASATKLPHSEPACTAWAARVFVVDRLDRVIAIPEYGENRKAPQRRGPCCSAEGRPLRRPGWAGLWQRESPYPSESPPLDLCLGSRAAGSLPRR